MFKRFMVYLVNFQATQMAHLILESFKSKGTRVTYILPHPEHSLVPVYFVRMFYFSPLDKETELDQVCTLKNASIAGLLAMRGLCDSNKNEQSLIYCITVTAMIWVSS
jgi:hypothetical protein